MTVENLLLVGLVVITLLAVIALLVYLLAKERELTASLHAQILETNRQLQLKTDARALHQEDRLETQQHRIDTQTFNTGERK